jgi:glycosyltransferase involved in cell wall biosynthesis
MEAAACATPTVAYDVTGIRDSVVNGKTGILAPFGSTEALAQSLLLILENEELRNEMATRARERSTHFSWDSTANSVERTLTVATEHSSVK